MRDREKVVMGLFGGPDYKKMSLEELTKRYDTVRKYYYNGLASKMSVLSSIAGAVKMGEPQLAQKYRSEAESFIQDYTSFMKSRMKDLKKDKKVDKKILSKIEKVSKIIFEVFDAYREAISKNDKKSAGKILKKIEEFKHEREELRDDIRELVEAYHDAGGKKGYVDSSKGKDTPFMN